jgi:ketopantoate reductase
MRIVVVGAGGVGGYFGGRLVQGGADVAFVARGAHLDALRTTGDQVRSVKGDFEVPVEATDDPSALGPADYVLVTVKSYDTDDVARAVAPLVASETAVVSLQNGIDNEERLAAVLGRQPDRLRGPWPPGRPATWDCRRGVTASEGGPVILTVFPSWLPGAWPRLLRYARRSPTHHRSTETP